MKGTILFLLAGAASGCSAVGAGVPVGGQSLHSSSIAVGADASTLFVVNPDADSVSILDGHAGTLVHEVLLAGTHPTVDEEGNFFPAVEPRALALAPGQATLFVTGHRSGRIYAVDAIHGGVLRSAAVCSEPVGVLVSAKYDAVYVACSADDEVISLDPSTLAVQGRVSCNRKPWTLSASADGVSIYVTHLLGPGVSVLATAPLTVSAVWTLADGPAHADPTRPQGPVRGIYDVLPRPKSGEVWIAHLMLGIQTAQPALAFNMTDFPAVSILDTAGAEQARLTVSTEPGDHGAFGDVVSGPHALAFSPDGSLAFMADSASEDVLVIDANQRVETPLGLVRPLPGHQPEGLAVASDGRIYVDERNTSDVAILAMESGPLGPAVSVTGTIPRLARDPMPTAVRRGQHVFYSANSDELPITTDHWVSCATCHLEGRTDAVTWRFKQGPRDTPSNAGGVAHTGFLFRTAARNKVQDYWQTIDIEQGGHFSTSVPALEDELDALAAYVNHGIPYPSAPSRLDPSEVSHGKELFLGLGCPRCHRGDYFTDSGSGNPSLDLGGDVALHDVGTCVTKGPYDDRAVPDEEGHPRRACWFDTPTLRGVGDSAPYLHDGSAATLDDVFRLAPGMVGPAATMLPDADRGALISYLRSL